MKAEKKWHLRVKPKGLRRRALPVETPYVRAGAWYLFEVNNQSHGQGHVVQPATLVLCRHQDSSGFTSKPEGLTQLGENHTRLTRLVEFCTPKATVTQVRNTVLATSIHRTFMYPLLSAGFRVELWKPEGSGSLTGLLSSLDTVLGM